MEFILQEWLHLQPEIVLNNLGLKYYLFLLELSRELNIRMMIMYIVTALHHSDKIPTTVKLKSKTHFGFEFKRFYPMASWAHWFWLE